MLTHPTYERLIALGLTGMAKALEGTNDGRAIPPPFDVEERLALMIDRETIERSTPYSLASRKIPRQERKPCSG